MKINKAAMFGLDARIALAIFGTLSVISGAALYSAIQDAKITGMVSDMNELGKALEGYMLDEGKDLPLNTSTYNLERLINNVDSSTVWRGPYLSYTLSTGYANKDWFDYLNNSGSRIGLRYLENNLGGANGGACTMRPCYAWVQITDLTTDVMKAIDIKVDGTDTPDSGKVRIVDAQTSIYMQGPLLFSQP